MATSRREFVRRSVAAASTVLVPPGCDRRGLGKAVPLAEKADLDFDPAYLKLEREGELIKREEALWEILANCETCARGCGANRLAGETGVCSTKARIKVYSAGPHHGEERELVGRGGSGTVFFSNCNLLCCFCQNWEINHRGDGERTTELELADIMPTSLYRLFDSLYEEVRGQWEERFEGRHGFWRGFVDEQVRRYLDCGLFENGFARVQCPECHEEYLLAFSCKTRELCPSCAARRAAATAVLLREDVLEEVGHAQWVFVMPKMLRPYFLHHRELLGGLSRAAWETVRELMVAATGEESLRPGMVAVVQTAGDLATWHPHVHALVSRGGWTRAWKWVPVAYVDEHAAELLYRHKVMRMLQDVGLLTEERTELLLSWRHTGFSVHNRVRVEPEDGPAVERLARYIMRPPISFERIDWSGDGEVLYRPKAGHDGRARQPGDPAETFDPAEFLARVIMHIPEPRRHLVRYYGAYSNVSRGKRRRQDEATSGAAPRDGEQAPSARARRDHSPDARPFRRSWAQLIKRVYEVDPLLCPSCGGEMRIIAFIIDHDVVDAILRHLATADAKSPRGPPSAAALSAVS